MPPGVDAVVDACDQVKVRASMAEWARRSDVIFIAVGATKIRPRPAFFLVCSRYCNATMRASVGSS